MFIKRTDHRETVQNIFHVRYSFEQKNDYICEVTNDKAIAQLLSVGNFMIVSEKDAETAIERAQAEKDRKKSIDDQLAKEKMAKAEADEAAKRAEAKAKAQETLGKIASVEGEEIEDASDDADVDELVIEETPLDRTALIAKAKALGVKASGKTVEIAERVKEAEENQ